MYVIDLDSIYGGDLNGYVLFEMIVSYGIKVREGNLFTTQQPNVKGISAWIFY